MMSGRFRAVLLVAALAASCTDGRDREDPEGVTRKLQSLPYTSWSPMEHRDKSGVVIHDPERAQPGMNVFNSLPRTRATLLDMDGTPLHVWSRDTGKEWGHVSLLRNGDLLVFNEEPRKLFRLDWDSNVVWDRDVDVHHDVDFSEEGDIYTLSAREEFLEYGGLEIPVRNHLILVLSPDGEILREISFLPLLQDRLDRGKLEEFVATGGEVDHGFRFEGDFVDVFHVNTVSIIDQTYNEFFQKGFILFCARSLNLIGVVDPDKEMLVWTWAENDLDWPHQPVLLESGNLLVFDNGAHRDYSRIVEIDPMKNEIVWEYRADPPEGFFTKMMGGIQSLPNGNILITESVKGHAFEVTREGDIVWEFYNPDVNEARNKRATIYRMTRIARDFLEPALLPDIR